MAIRRELTFKSRDGVTECHAYTWEPEDGKIKAVLQIVHGMVEYMDRYDAFAEFMTANGFLVAGEDHLGHGHTALTDADLGYFCKNDPETVLVRDVHRLKKIVQGEHPGIPYFILGHSMGSFIFRKYLTMYGRGINGAIVMGTGVMPPIVTGTGIFTTNFLSLFHGDRYKSPFITKTSFGSYNKRIPNPRTEKDWLSVNEENVDKYLKDKYCTFDFTLNAYRALFKILAYDCKTKNLTTIPKTLPILVTSGLDDPVGNYGKGPSTVYEQYKKLGITDVTLKLYEGMRHEILNENDRAKVYDDILCWLNSKITE